MATLTVGLGKQYSTISSAVSASRDGDIVQVDAGTYTNDFATINTKITLQGVGGMVKMVATGNIPNDKGILVAKNDLTVDHFEFSGAKGPSANDAGIRYESGNLVVTNSYFHDNQNGILSNPSTTGTITIDNTEFAHNGTGDGYTHNLYVGDIAKLTITDSYFHDAVIGHEIKSRAHETIITNTRIFNNSGSGSYNIDLPNGGKATLTGNVIEQGPNSDNPTLVSFGPEGNVYSGSSLTMSNNIIVNDMTRGTVVANSSTAPVSITGSQFWAAGTTSMSSGSNVTVSGTTNLSARPVLDTTSHPYEGTTTPTVPTTPTTPTVPTTPTTPTVPTTPTTPTTPEAGQTLNGGSRNDNLSGGAGADTINGGNGQDQLRGNDGADSIDGGRGNDTIYGGNGNDWLVGGQDQDFLFGDNGNDTIYGNAGNDSLQGGAGNDTLLGGQNNDTIVGGDGADWLSGDAGSDTLTGGAGADIFHTGRNAGSDRVLDFKYAEGDRVQLDAGTSYTLVDTGPDVLIKMSGGAQMTLSGVDMSSLGSGWIFTA